MAARFDAFETMMDGEPGVVAVHVRDGISVGALDALVRALDAIPWSLLQHAYGNASDVPALLYAITVGHGGARKAAWWELWGNIHHQGTVYEATVPAVRFIGSIAADADHPDRVQALCFLREIAVGSGQLAPAASAAVRPVAEALLRGSRNEPVLVQRAMLWLLAAFPSLVSKHEDLLRLLPDSMRATWDDVLDRLRRRGEDHQPDEAGDAAFDRQHELEAWALAGWVEPAVDGA